MCGTSGIAAQDSAQFRCSIGGITEDAVIGQILTEKEQGLYA